MELLERPFTGMADENRMANLACQLAADHLHVVDLPYRFSSWAFDNPDNIHLWYNEDQHLIAWAVLQTPFWALDYACQPDAGTCLFGQILRWADQRAAALVDSHFGRPTWFVDTFSDREDYIRELEKAGFANQTEVGEDSWSKVFMHLQSQPEITEQLAPADFSIRPLRGESEAEAYVELQRAVFGSKNMTTEWRARTLRHPEYISDLDLVAEAPDGNLTAFCIGWINRKTSQGVTGQIEPLGVHENYQKMGLGGAILMECIRRLQLHGASRIYVETDNYRDAALNLYEASGFRIVKEILVFRKDYKETSS